MRCCPAWVRSNESLPPSIRTQHIVAAMRQAGVTRLLCLSAGAVEVPTRASWLVRMVTRYVLQKVFRHL